MYTTQTRTKKRTWRLASYETVKDVGLLLVAAVVAAPLVHAFIESDKEDARVARALAQFRSDLVPSNSHTRFGQDFETTLDGIPYRLVASTIVDDCRQVEVARLDGDTWVSNPRMPKKERVCGL